MTLDRRRYGRQMRLQEIGEAGQTRLCAAAVALTTRGFARTVEERYVRGAGMAVVDRPSNDPSPTPALDLRHEAAREVGEGAFAALAAIRAALDTSGQ